MAFIYDLTDTWNAGGTTFNAIKMNVTDSASAAASKLVTLQVGGSERFGVRKDGQTYVAGSLGVGTSSPVSKLDVAVSSAVAGTFSRDGSDGDVIQIFNGTAGTTKALYLGVNSTSGVIGSQFGGLIFDAGSVERMRIDSSGNVGVGTSSPDAVKLHVVQGTKAGLAVVPGEVARFESTVSNRALVPIIGRALGQSELWFGDENLISVGRIRYDHTVDAMAFWGNNNERMRIDSSGRVGVGTSSPAVQLHLLNSDPIIRLTDAETGAHAQINASSTVGAVQIQADALNTVVGSFIGLSVDGTERMRIDSSGNVGIGETSPGSWKINVRSGSTSKLRLYNDTGNGNIIDFVDQGWQSQINGSAGNLLFNTGGTTERMRIDSSGRVGVGDSSPQGVVHITRSISYPNATNSDANAWNNTDKSHIKLESNNNALAIGVDSTSNSRLAWIQAGHENAAFANAVDTSELALQPLGGNVGIGTSSPARKFVVSNAGVEGLEIDPSLVAGQVWQVNYNRSTFAYVSSIDSALDKRFFTGSSPTERMRIDSSGNLLVGTTSAPVSGTAGVQISPTFIRVGTSATTQTGLISFNNPNGEVGLITTSGTSTSYLTSSDARLKHDIVDAPEASSLIDQIKVRSFKWNADNSEQRYGMVAQELLEVAPEAVSGEPEGEEMMGVDYSKLVPMLIKEVQSLRARVAQLEG